MAFIDTIPARWVTGEAFAMYDRQQKHYGYVPNYATVFSHRPMVMRRWAELLAEIKRPMDIRRFELATFAAAYGAENRPFFVMAMPSLWRAEERHKNDPHLDLLIRAVFVHEMTHTLQTPVLGPRLDDLITRHKLPEDLDDDVVQKRFGDRPGFREAYERERDLLFRAVAEPDRARRRALAGEAAQFVHANGARLSPGEGVVGGERVAGHVRESTARARGC